MKIFRTALAAIVAAAALSASADDFIDRINFTRYASDNDRLRVTAADTPRVVFFGNSITEGWPAHHGEFFTSHPGFIGRGISGQTTYQFLGRFREDVLNLLPDIVVINGATNDIAENMSPYNEDYTMGNIMSMAELARANGVKVILTSVLPMGKVPWHPSVENVPEKVSSLNNRIRTYAEAMNIPYVDYYSALVASTPEQGRPQVEGAINAAYSPDGVHPNADGYAVMEALVLPVINSLR